MSEQEERIDGSELQPLDEDGSDNRLGDDAKQRIHEARDREDEDAQPTPEPRDLPPEDLPAD